MGRERPTFVCLISSSGLGCVCKKTPCDQAKLSSASNREFLKNVNRARRGSY